MAAPQIRFEDAAAYERMMGTWSRLAGDIFLDWLAPEPLQRWIDVGCGNGAFTERLIARCAPAEVQGIDPSTPQLDFARARPGARMAEFRQGDAMALPVPDDRFDAAVMALVLFFVPDPAKCVAEMARVVAPGGVVSAYTWDIHGGGFPLEPFRLELAALGIKAPIPPGSDASRIDVSRRLWAAAGLEAIEAKEIPVERTFADFDDLWTISLGSSVRAVVTNMTSDNIERLKGGLRTRLPADAAGRITYGASANAIKGRVPR